MYSRLSPTETQFIPYPEISMATSVVPAPPANWVVTVRSAHTMARYRSWELSFVPSKEMCALLKKSSSVEEWLQLMRETVEERGKGKEMDKNQHLRDTVIQSLFFDFVMRKCINPRVPNVAPHGVPSIWLQLMRETVEERGKGKEMDNYSAVAIRSWELSFVPSTR